MLVPRDGELCDETLHDSRGVCKPFYNNGACTITEESFGWRCLVTSCKAVCRNLT